MSVWLSVFLSNWKVSDCHSKLLVHWYAAIRGSTFVREQAFGARDRSFSCGKFYFKRSQPF
jgi:hypothetical protein